MSMSWMSSLRGRLMVSYAVALALALATFGAAAVVVIDRGLHASLDARLRTTAQAALDFVDVKNGQAQIDKHDRGQLFAVLEPQTDLAIVSGGSAPVFSTAVKPAQTVLASAAQLSGLMDLPQGHATIRALVLPIASDGKRIGSVVVWTNPAWIRETDRGVAVAFGVAALLLAGVASLAGMAVTRRALEDAFNRQRRFTTDASHELRAPLSIIRAEADLALRTQRDAATYQAAMRTIAAEADRMETLVGSLLSAARAQNVRGEPAIMDLQDLAQRVRARLEPAATAKRVSIALREAQGCNVLGDADALESAVTAVLHNAIKYTPAGGSIDIWTARHRRSVELCIRDGGSGFSDEALVHGLEWFWCGDPARGGEASGVGLAIASSIARASGGHMALENTADGGAQVSISLPAR